MSCCPVDAIRGSDADHPKLRTDDKQKAVLLGYLDGIKSDMDVDSKPVAIVKNLLSVTGLTSSRSATPSGTRPGTPMRHHHDNFVPEEDIYLTLLVIVFLLDQKELSKVSINCPLGGYLTTLADDTFTWCVFHAGQGVGRRNSSQTWPLE